MQQSCSRRVHTEDPCFSGVAEYHRCVSPHAADPNTQSDECLGGALAPDDQVERELDAGAELPHALIAAFASMSAASLPRPPVDCSRAAGRSPNATFSQR